MEPRHPEILQILPERVCVCCAREEEAEKTDRDGTMRCSVRVCIDEPRLSVFD